MGLNVAGESLKCVLIPHVSCSSMIPQWQGVCVFIDVCLDDVDYVTGTHRRGNLQTPIRGQNAGPLHVKDYILRLRVCFRSESCEGYGKSL